MKKFFSILGVFLPGLFLYGQVSIDTSGTINAYLDHFRDNKAVLTAFFKAFPKGADLHHHYSGSVPMEIYVDHVLRNYWIELNTLQVSERLPKRAKGNWQNFAQLKASNQLDVVRNNLIQAWSVREFPGVEPSEHFFDAFNKFSLAKNQTFEQGLLALKQIAREENLVYLETMFASIDCSLEMEKEKQKNESLLFQAQEGSLKDLYDLFDQLYNEIEAEALQCAVDHNEWVAAYHQKLEMESEDFSIRYQNYVVRVKEPLNLFKDLVLCFLSADASPLMVGVNIVAPEHHYIAIRDYRLHMRMFAYLKEKFPAVNVAMHAGELTPDIASPIELNFHIQEAVNVAGAQRIGHGVDIAYEQNSHELLRQMKDNGVAVEINLSSNEFILGVKAEEHPISLYHMHKVPVVLCTDDAGILRTTLTDQYVLLCQRYEVFSYDEIKEVSVNGIQYSFIEEENHKNDLLRQLKQRFRSFEQQVVQLIEGNAQLRPLLMLK